MTRIHSRSEKRSAFTLVEIMVVILIIAILVTLLSAAVVMVMGRIPEVKTRTEIAEMSVALQAFMNDYNLSDPPPSVLVLSEASPLTTVSGPFLQKVFGKNLGPTDWNGDNAINGPATGWVLEGEQCLVFYLGGIPNTAAVAGGAPPGPQGFSTNNFNPSTPGGKRKGPYFNFETPRLVPLPSNGFYVYVDPWQVKTIILNPNLPWSAVKGQAYAYFSSLGLNNSGYLTNSLLDCQTIGATPYWTAVSGTTPSQFTNSNTYQIISAGKDGTFGGGLWSPPSGAQKAGADDQANFSSTLLGKGQN